MVRVSFRNGKKAKYLIIYEGFFLFSKPQTGVAATASMLERYKVAVEERVNLKHVHRWLQAPRLLPPLGPRESQSSCRPVAAPTAAAARTSSPGPGTEGGPLGLGGEALGSHTLTALGIRRVG